MNKEEFSRKVKIATDKPEVEVRLLVDACIASGAPFDAVYKFIAATGYLPSARLLVWFGKAPSEMIDELIKSI